MTQCKEKKLLKDLTEVLIYDHRALEFSHCHPKDYFCAILEKNKFDSDFIASPPRIFAGDGRALMTIDTDCVDPLDYYTIGLYWSGKEPGYNHFTV